MSRAGLADLGVLLVLPATVAAALLLGQTYAVTLATKAAILALAGVGLNLALGYGGLVSFGHAAFFGIGGYVAGILAHHAAAGTAVLAWPLAIGGTKAMLALWPAAMLAAAVAALAIGALSLRTSGVYFIMITLAFAQMVYYFAVAWPAYGGEDGLSFYVRNRFPGLDTFDPASFFAICFGCLALALLLSARLVGSHFGLVLRAVRQNPVRVASSGIEPYRIRLAAFVISGAITGLAGALYADLNRFVSPAMLSWQTSGEIMVLVILGGVGRLMGPVAGAALYLLLEEMLGGLTPYWHVLLGLILLLVVLGAPGGVMGALAGGGRRG